MSRILVILSGIAVLCGCDNMTNGGGEGHRERPVFALRGRTNQGALAVHTYARTGGDHDPCVSSDGKWLLFSSSRHTRNPQLYLKKVDSQVVIRRTFNNCSNIQPKFSRDGSLIAYASDASGNWDIWITPRDKGPAVNFTDDLTSEEIHPSWHPTRSILAFSSYDPVTGDWYVCARSRSNGGFQILTPGLFPEWSPDGKRIVYQRARERGVKWYSVWMIDVEVDSNDNVDCSQPAEVVASDRWAAINPAWSPDGRHLAFASVYKSPAARSENRLFRGDDIWMVGVDGRDLARLTSTDAPDWDPFWVADTSGGPGRIYFTSLMGGHANVWSLRPVIVDIPGSIQSNKEAEADEERRIIEQNRRAQQETGAVELGTRIGLPAGVE